ncbi:ABC transporter substrate-binding protein [Jiangella asiatica]|uniref:Extracellular solute-binding protein n=1 Tax=Jiangella asiatica TaxID=2530372 RepID=A0A4V2Z0P5_9ACTN|nr:extracellular solute-binding protein [Jiangella asiatica]TDE01168.1 extracellular solute-binding protein [Jiangella asiatica]
MSVLPHHRRHLAVGAALTALVLTGCGALGGASDSASSGELSMWTEWSGGYQASADALFAEFEEKNPDIAVAHRAIGNEDFFTAVRTGLSGNTPPDVIQFEGYQQTRDFAGAGQLLDVTDIWEDVKDQYLLSDSLVSACEVDGKVYCLPWSLSTVNQVFYDPTLLEQAGVEPPTTMEELVAAGETLKDAGITPIALGAKDGWPANHWFNVFVGHRCGYDVVYQAINQDGAAWTDDCFVQAATDLENLASQGMFNEGVASSDYDAMTALFLSGRTAMMNTGQWFVSSWTDSPPPFDVGIVPFPAWSDAAFPNVIQGTVGHTIGISSQTDHEEDAKALLRYFTTPEAGRIWAEGGNLSPIDGVTDQYGTDAIKQVFEAFTSAEAFLPFLENELPPAVGEDALYNGAAAVAAGNLTGQEWMQQVQAAAEAAAG